MLFPDLFLGFAAQTLGFEFRFAFFFLPFQAERLFLFLADIAGGFVLLVFAGEPFGFLTGEAILFFFFKPQALFLLAETGFLGFAFAAQRLLLEFRFGQLALGKVGFLGKSLSPRLLGKVRLARGGFLGFALFALHRLAGVAEFLASFLFFVLVSAFDDLGRGQDGRHALGQAAFGFFAAAVDLFGAFLFLFKLSCVSFLFGLLDRLLALGFGLGVLRRLLGCAT